MLTGRWLRCDRTLAPVRPDTKRQRLVDSSKVPVKGIYDRTRSISTDRTLRVQRPVESSKGPVRVSCDQTRPVSGDRTLPASGQYIFTGSRVELTGASGQHDRSVRSPRRGS